MYHIHFQINVLRGYCWAPRYPRRLGFEREDDRRSILPPNLPLRSARVYIALPYIKPRIFMHSVPVAILTAEERGEATRGPKGREQPHSSAIDIHYSRSTEAESASRPLGDRNTLCPYQCWEQGFSPQLTTTLAAATLALPLPRVSLGPGS